MRLFHYSPGAYTMLKPVQGKNDKTPVVWLMQAPDCIARDGDGNAHRYRHEVAINDGDPLLVRDTSLDDLFEDAPPEVARPQWYTCPAPLEVVEIREFSSASESYDKVVAVN